MSTNIDERMGKNLELPTDKPTANDNDTRDKINLNATPTSVPNPASSNPVEARNEAVAMSNNRSEDAKNKWGKFTQEAAAKEDLERVHNEQKLTEQKELLKVEDLQRELQLKNGGIKG